MKIYKDDFEFKAEQTKGTDHRKTKIQFFENNNQKMQTYINP